MNNKAQSLSDLFPYALILFIVIAYTVLGFLIPPVGDDLGFIESFKSQNDCWYAFPRYVYRAWLWNNARMADMLNPIGYFYMPQWLQALSNGVVVGLMYYLAVGFSSNFNLRSPLFSVGIIFIMTFIMRWDGIWMEYNTFYNYIWSSSFVMLALRFLFSKHSQTNKWYWWLILPFCFIASSMHEAIGVPLALSLCLLIIFTPLYKEASLLRRATIISMILGGMFTLSSPASYKRIGSMLQPESPILILFGSSVFVVILILLILYLFAFRKSLLYSLIRTQWIVFIGVSLFSSGFMLLSGFGGRTGWFAQLFAMIAVAQVIEKSNIKIGKVVRNAGVFLMSGLIIFHLYMLVVWQQKLSYETEEVIDEYKKASDGIIYFDYTKDYEMPWYLMRKNHGVPDDDDTYYRYRMRRHYGNGKQLVILPTAFNPIPNTENLPIASNGFILTSVRPVQVYGDTIVAIFPRELTYVDGKEYIINEFDNHGQRLYLLSLMDRDRGEK